jgi:hypothetical protein
MKYRSVRWLLAVLNLALLAFLIVAIQQGPQPGSATTPLSHLAKGF